MRLFLVAAVLIAIAKRRQLADFVAAVRESGRTVGARRTARQIMNLFLPSKGIFSDESIAEYNRQHKVETDQP